MKHMKIRFSSFCLDFVRSNSNNLFNMLAVIAGYFIAVFIFNYVKNEHPMYYWDWGGYFDLYKNLGYLATHDLIAAIHSLFTSIQGADYNLSPVVVLLPFYILLGDDRTSYILAIAAVYLIPAAIVSYYLFKQVYSYDFGNITKYALLAYLIFYPPFWQASLRGLPDIVGLIPLGLAATVIIKSHYLKNHFIRNSIAVGLLIWLAFMFRRWYVFSGLALLSCTLIVNLTLTWLQTKSPKQLLNSLMPFIISATCIALLVALFQYQLLIRILATSYADIYQAYQAPFIEKLITLYNTTGLFSTVLIFTGIAFAIIQRAYSALFLALVAIVAFLMFSTIQAPGIQHALPWHLFLIPVSLLPITLILSAMKPVLRSITAILMMILVLGIFLVSFSQGGYQDLSVFKMMAPHDSFHPLRLPNYPEYQRLLKDMHRMLANDDKFSVFASSGVMADSLVHALDNSLDPHLLLAGQIDEIHGFRIANLETRLAIIVDPVPTHTHVSSQQVIIVPAEMIYSGQGIGKDYHQVSGPYLLDAEHRAYIYERIKPVTPASIHILESALQSHHPQWRWNGKDLIH